MRGTWDFAVVGAGPAGSRAAELFARRGAAVLLLDPKAPWEKPCGGGLTAAALRHTPELEELRDASQTIEEVMVVGPRGSSVVVPLRRPFRVISRLTLSRWGLERATAAGACFRPSTVQSADRTAEGWRILDSAGDTHRARRLIAADGAASRLRGLLAPAFRPELAPARVAYPLLGAPPGRAVFLFLRSTQGYVWDFPRPGHHSVGVGVPPGTFQRGPLDGAIAQYRMAEAGDGEPADHRGAVIAVSRWASGSFRDLGGRAYALLGDAAGLADPATGEGIDYALRSASLAAQVYDDRLGFERYPAAARTAFRAEMRRARLIRGWLYRGDLAERLVRAARRSPRAAVLLMALVDAINEHDPLGSVVRRAAFSSLPDRRAAEAVCVCPDGWPQGKQVLPGPGDLQRLELSVGELPDAAAGEVLTGRLRNLAGVSGVTISPVTERAVVLFDPAITRVEDIVRGFAQHGLAVGHAVARWHLRIASPRCAHCARRIEAAVSRVPGVRGATVNHAEASLTVEYTPPQADLDLVRATVVAEGFHLAFSPPGTP
jgi:flavin-dependent dehydrogenase/copper chaperone CopZ